MEYVSIIFRDEGIYKSPLTIDCLKPAAFYVA